MNQELIELVTSDMTGEILHAVEIDGVVAVVEKRPNGEVWYHAREYYVDGVDGGYCEAGGYSTTERYWYMGERYRSPALWGPYFTEVFR